MKKAITFLLLLAIVSSLASCSSLTNNNKNDTIDTTEAAISETEKSKDTVSTPKQSDYTPSTKDIPSVTTPTNDINYTFGSTVVCEGFEITFGTEISWTVVDNEYSDYHNADVIAIPISVKNVGQETDNPRSSYFDYFNPNGNELEDIDHYFDDGIFEMGKLRPGASSEAVIHILYEGDGDYYIEYDGLDDHFEIKLPISK